MHRSLRAAKTAVENLAMDLHDTKEEELPSERVAAHHHPPPPPVFDNVAHYAETTP
jgi:hypothetical protein